MTDTKFFDVIIIGGSYAGLSAAMALGRSLRSVLIIDGGKPCNRQTPHSHNFITQDGIAPGTISERAKHQVLKYDTVKFVEDFAVSGEKSKGGFQIKTKSGKEFSSKKLIFATGIIDLMPQIKGFSECWGISVIHCPYCHGYEFRQRKTAILADANKAMHLAPLVKNLTDDLTILTSGKVVDFKTEELQKLADHTIGIIDVGISEIVHHNGYVQNVLFKNGDSVSFEGIYASIPFKQHSEIPTDLGCKLTESGHIHVDSFQKTTIEGVFACGDSSGMMRSVANAVYSGSIAGAVVNGELSNELF